MCWTPLRYFQEDEFMPGAEKSSKEIRFLIDDIRQASTDIAKDKKDVSCIIHCCWAAKGHSAKSYHYTGQAIDFHITGVPLILQYTILTSFRGIGALGFYPYWHHPGWHLDIRPNDRRLEWLCTKIQSVYETKPHYNYDYGAHLIMPYLINM